MSLTESQIKALFPRASESLLKRNLTNEPVLTETPVCPPASPTDASAQDSRPIPEQALRAVSLGTPQAKNGHPKRFLVRIESVRLKTLDPDNLVGGCKFLLDACRQCGAIPGDAPDQIELEVFQSKAKRKADETTFVTIIQPHLR